MLCETIRIVLPGFAKFPDASETHFLEGGVAYGKNFVQDEDLGIHLGCNGKRQARVHARRVLLNRGIDKFSDFRKKMRIARGVMDNGRLMILETTAATGKTSLGTLIFLIRSPLPTIDSTA
jgi:hypothetical protein